MNFFMKSTKPILLLLFILIQKIKSDNKEEIIFDGKNIERELNSISDIYYFHVNIKNGYEPKYLRIFIQGKESNEIINHIISFYQQDSLYKKRTQLSQSLNSETELFLNKDQIKSEFFFTVECDNYPCSYKYIIYEEEKIEINLENRYSYTYYVTEETKEMQFVIHGKPELPSDAILKGNNVLTVWAKGNKKIISILVDKKESDYYNVHFFKLEKLDEFNYNFKVTGEVGDLLNIGVSFFDGTFHNLNYNSINGNINEISGFLKNDIKETNCFLIKKTGIYEEGLISYTNYNNFNIDLMTVVTNYKDSTFFKKCLTISDANEGFYSFQYIKQNNEKSGNIYPPQILGVQYSRYIKEGDAIQLIPIKPDKDFKYITYNINIGHAIKINAYINSCETYPLCDTTEDTIKNSKKITSYYSFSISFSKKEFDEFCASPIDKKQKILIIECEKGDQGIHNYREQSNSCLIKINMYTDQNKYYIEPYISHYRYIQKNNNDNFIVGLKDNKAEYMLLNIELFSGNYSIILSDVNQKMIEHYSHNNKNLYIIKDKECTIKISASENSFYHLNYILKNIYAIDYTFTIGANYLFNLGKKKYENILFSESSNIYNIQSKKNNPIIISFYPYKCEFELTNTIDLNKQPKSLNKENDFYQDISINNEQNINIVSLIKIYNYTIFNKVNKENCLIDVSYFKYNNEIYDTEESIILSIGCSRQFKFTSNYKILKFTYPHVEKDKNITIDFQLINGGKYKMHLFFNDKNSYSQYEINKNTLLTIERDNFEKRCDSNNQMCKISFNLESQGTNESILQITILSENDKQKEKGNENKSNSKSLAIILSIASLFIVVVIIIVIFKFIKKNRNLSNIKEDIKKQEGFLNGVNDA